MTIRNHINTYMMTISSYLFIHIGIWYWYFYPITLITGFMSKTFFVPLNGRVCVAVLHSDATVWSLQVQLHAQFRQNTHKMP